MLPEDLQRFEAEVAALFEAKQIRAPCHLSGGNEEQLIHIFKDIGPDDWVFSTHRSHYHALLKGIPADWLKGEIIAGRSITINSRDHKFFSSAIVGGILPIALGVALAGHPVWAFVGDMAAETGIFHECAGYARGHDLPIRFVVESNGYSVCTPTQEVWGLKTSAPKTQRYEYKSKWPHQGCGRWVQF